MGFWGFGAPSPPPSSRDASLLNPDKVQIGEGAGKGMIGKTIIHAGVVIRGDLQSVKIGKYSFVDTNTLLKPSSRMIRGEGQGF